VVVNKTITFNGSSSYDSDGEILLYNWNFGDGNTSIDMVANHSYSCPGIYFVNLTVSDNDDLTNMIQKIIVVSSKLQATIDIDPDTLNLNSTGKWITCHIEFPDGYKVEDIDINTIMLNDVLPANTQPTNISDYDQDGIPDLMVKFDRQNIIDILEPGDNVEIIITGQLIDGTKFEGIDFIDVI
jgi:PKD repeat protein